MSKFSPDAIARRAQQAGVEPGPHGPVSEQFMRHYYGPGYSPSPVKSDDGHVAWCRYDSGHGKPTRIVLCDSDSPGAFRVFHERDHMKVVDALIASESLMHKAHQEHCASEQRSARLFDALTKIVSAYDAWRARGVIPAPWEYVELVQIINDARVHLTKDQ